MCVYEQFLNNSNSLLSPGPIATCVSGRHLRAHQVPRVHISNGPLSSSRPKNDKYQSIAYVLWFYIVVFFRLDNIELDAQVPATFPSSQSQRHHQVAVLNFPHIRVQRNRVHSRHRVPKRKGKQTTHFILYYIHIGVTRSLN